MDTKKKSKFIVDRIEENVVVVEDEKLNIINIPKEKIKFEVKEQDVIIEDEDKKYILDENATEERKKHINELTKDLWQ
jgi:hypothetical protein